MKTIPGPSPRRLLQATAILGLFVLAEPGTSQSTQPATTQAAPDELLDQILLKVQFDSLPAEQVLDQLAHRLGVRIAVDWKDVGFENDKPASLDLHGVTGRTALTLLIADLSDPDHPADFVVRNGQVVISSARTLDGPITVCDYDLRPLLSGDAAPLKNVHADDVVAVIQGATRRGTWAGSGDTGSLLVRGSTLRIKQSARGHAEIQNLLNSLKEPRPLVSPEWKQSRETEVALRKTLPTFSVDSVPCDQTLSWFAELTGLNVTVNWWALSDAGFERDVPLTASAKDVSFERALEMLLAKVATGKTHADYDFVGGVVVVGTPAALEQTTSWRVYDLASAAGKAQERRAEIVTRIQRDALPSSWRSKGGSGQFWLVGDRLVILQSCRGHLAVERVLAALGI